MNKLFYTITAILYKLLGPKHSFELAMSPLGKRIFKTIVGEKKQIIQIKTKYNFLIRLTKYQYLMSGYFFLGETNPLETNLVRKLLTKGDVFFDIGAHIGWYTLNASQIVSGTGKVYAFEPNPDIYNECKENCTINNMNNVIIEKIALSDKDGTDTFWVGDDMGGSLIKENTQKLTIGYDVEKIKVKTEKINTFCKNKKIKKIALIKIDVEGAEMKILAYAEEIIKKYKPSFIIEILDEKQKIDIINYFKKFNYSPYSFTSEGLHKINADFSAFQTVNLFFTHEMVIEKLRNSITIN